MKWAILLLPFCSSTIFGQSNVKEYFDRQGEKCSPESSYYYSLGKKNRNGFFYDTLKSFYSRSNHIKAIELRDQFGNRMGLCTAFYENGNLQSKTRHDKKLLKNGEAAPDSVDYSILEFNDSLGHPLVVNGEGFVRGRLDFSMEQGKVVNGLRDSVWTTFFEDGNVYCYESWQGGHMIDGISYDKNGKEYYYKQQLVLPSPALGMQEFYKEMAKKITYPKEAQRRGIQGRVIVEIMIEKDGSITSPKILQGLGFGCDEEALKALTSSAPWILCKLKGQPVEFELNIPVVFELK